MSINVVPTPYIIAESFPIESSIREYFTTLGKNSFFTDLEEKNQREKVNSLEKTLEVSGNAVNIINSDTTKNNKDYLLKLGGQCVLDHSTITVLFNNISLSCIDAIQDFNVHHTITREQIRGDLKFWLSPSYVSQELALMFRDLFVRFNNLKKNLIGKHKVNENELERIYPLSAATNCLYTTGVWNWKQLLIAGTQFEINSECRYVLLELAKLFKARYHNAFVNMYLVDKDGKTYGLDTLKSDVNAWQFYKIFFSG